MSRIGKKAIFIPEDVSVTFNEANKEIIVNTANLTENQVFQCIGRIGRIGLSTSGKVLDMNGSIIRVLLGI
jgi:ribosomal protein L6P/L9E